MSGPLTGLKVIEIAGLGPGPFCGMMLADLGADVTRIERLNGAMTVPMDLLNRGRKNLAVNLKSTAGVTLVKKLVVDADVFIEGFRPGVIERLGAEIAKLEQLMADPELFSREPVKFRKATEALSARQAALAEAEDEWLELEERAAG